jgi:hypothetical protein
VVVWRGGCTGVGEISTSTRFSDNKNDGKDVALLHRCAKVSSMIDFKIDDTLYQGRIHMAELLQYKYLLSLEGNDVLTRLKWMLASNSVVFMPPPTALPFTMESKLLSRTFILCP